jgi:multidrug efflux pump subunit AcrA (membrane-fusion protein)
MNAKRKSKVRRLLVFGLLILVLVAAGAAYVLRPKALPYDSAVAQKGDITTNYTFSGNIETKNRQTVMSERMLQVSKLNVKEGDQVKAGAVLLKTTTGEEIKAKIKGEIANLAVDEGAQVMAGTALMDIVDYDNLQVEIKVDEYDLSAVKTGKEATVKIGALQKELTGTVGKIAKEGTVSNGVTFFVANVDLKKDPNLKIGMSAEITLLNQKAAGVVTLPMTAVQFDSGNNPYVLKKENNGAFSQTAISTGINDGQRVEVKKGIAAGETVYYPKTTTGTGFGLEGGSQETQRTQGTQRTQETQGGQANARNT